MEDIKKQIVIADPDIEHIKSYEEELILRFQPEASIQIITEHEYLENYFRIHRDIDVLLISKEFYGIYLKEHNISNIMIVNDKETTKYHSKDEILTFIEKSLAGDNINDDIDVSEMIEDTEERTTRVVSVYSPIGGAGKSLAALALSKKLKRLGESVLVIGCDNLQSFGAFIDTRDNAEPELALMLQEINDGTYFSILKNIYHGDITCILPFEKPLSEMGIGSVQLYDLIMLLKEKKDFSYVILDLDSNLSRAVQTMMSISDDVIIITEPKMSSCRMIEKLMMNRDLISNDNIYMISNQYRTEGFHLDQDKLFGVFAGYDSAEEAMEDPLFYRLALELS